MNKWGMKGIVLGLCLSMMAPMAVAMVPGMSVEAAAAEDELKADIKEKAAELRDRIKELESLGTVLPNQAQE